MHKLTFFPLGNADCCRIDLESGKQILLDYADTKCYEDPSDKRIALPSRLKADLNGRDYYDVVGYTHLDDDHVHDFRPSHTSFTRSDLPGGGSDHAATMFRHGLRDRSVPSAPAR